MGVVWTLLVAVGCSDDPETKAAKTVRKQTAEAVNASLKERDYAGAQQKVMAALEQNRTGGLTQDAALLASGNLALANGRQMQADLGSKIQPLNISMEALEKNLRRAEQLLIEKERIMGLLAAGDQEIAELKQVLEGDGGLQKQLEQANARMTELNSQKDAVQVEKDKAQAVLDDYQARADALLRQAEVAQGDEKLNLQKQAYDLLEQRKEYYIQVQGAEDSLTNLEGDIALVQGRMDGANRGIDEIAQRIAAIESSENRTALKQQMSQNEADISDSQQRMARAADEATAGYRACQEMTDRISAVFEEAAAEFEKIHSGDATFAAAVRLAESAHRAAQVGAASVKVQLELVGRFQNLTETADPNIVSSVQSRFAIQPQVQAERKQKILGRFDRAIETYENALTMAGAYGQTAECNILKSQLLAYHDKMQFADMCGDFELATKTETAMMELIKKGTEKGVCFTQSEALKMIENEGLNYMPSMPLNMEVFIEGKRQEFSAWKRLPITEQEAAVDENIRQIDGLIAQYGQEMSAAMEPLKQEMLAAKERGFKEEPTPETAPGEPNTPF
jgi:hypothetical protein